MFAMKKKICLLLVLGSCTGASAFTCHFTVVKDSCWTPYDVKVTAADTKDKKVLTTALIPAKKSWARTTFDCSPGQKLEYLANFSPAFWDSEAGKIYRAKQYQSLNAKIDPTDVAWDLKVCFPQDFAEVPFPPQGHKNCKCDFSQVEPLENKDKS